LLPSGFTSLAPRPRRRRRRSGPPAVPTRAVACLGLRGGVGGSVTTGGSGIPRLQELSYLEVVARGVGDGFTFEDIRKRLVEHMATLGETTPGTGNTAVHRNAVANPKRYVNNATEALKELMKLGLME